MWFHKHRVHNTIIIMVGTILLSHTRTHARSRAHTHTLYVNFNTIIPITENWTNRFSFHLIGLSQTHYRLKTSKQGLKIDLSTAKVMDIFYSGNGTPVATITFVVGIGGTDLFFLFEALNWNSDRSSR